MKLYPTFEGLASNILTRKQKILLVHSLKHKNLLMFTCTIKKFYDRHCTNVSCMKYLLPHIHFNDMWSSDLSVRRARSPRRMVVIYKSDQFSYYGFSRQLITLKVDLILRKQCIYKEKIYF